VSLFLGLFFLVYSGFHFYAYQRVSAAFHISRNAGIILAVFFILMICAPILVRLSENAGHDSFARGLSYGGYAWMGLLFLFVSSGLLIDIFRFILYAAGSLFDRDLSAISISKKNAFIIPLIVSLAIVVYGYFEAKDIRIERIVVPASKLPSGTAKLRIVQISDIHLGLIVREERLKRILEKVRAADPDILVSTGDLVDGQINRLEGLAELFEEIKPKYGKYAVTGNHEFYAGLSQALDFTRKSGFRVLRQELVNVEEIIHIAGVDDRTVHYYEAGRDISEKVLLSGDAHDKYTLLLKHRPIVDPEGARLFDLQLSGHVHKGQIFPFSLLTALYYETQSGLAHLKEGSFLYVSRGTGTWGPPVRFLSPPEVSVIDLVNAPGTGGEQ
jgi:predicted MPP superfamily phosphohydrolase